MHFRSTLSNSIPVIIKLHIWVICQERHWDRAVGYLFTDHKRGQSLSEWIIMRSGLPDGNFFCHPGLHRSNGYGL